MSDAPIYDEGAGRLDYRELLRKYIEYVGECEGVDFLNYYRGLSSGVGFTDEEFAELRKVAGYAE